MRHKSENKVLRIGLIHGGRVVEERLFKKPETISVGTSRSAVFSVPAAGIPEKREVFVVKRGRYHLACGDDLPFRVTSAGSTSERRAAETHSRLTTHDSGQPMPLAEDAQGRVQIGEVMLLFQFVTPPPEPPRLQLPEMTMVRWPSRVDRSFLAILSWVVMIHIGVVMAVQSAPLPKEPTGIVDDMGRPIEVFFKPTPAPADVDKTPDNGKGTKETPEPKKTSKTTGKVAAGGGGPIDVGKLRESVRRKGVIAVIASRENGSALDRMFRGDSVKPEDVLDGTAVASSSLENSIASGRIKFGNADGGPATIEDLETGAALNPDGVAGPGTAGPKVAVVAPPQFGTIELEIPEVEGCLDPTAISRVVKSRLRLIQDCYEKELKKNPSLAGKVTVRFTIDSGGTVTEARVESDQLGSPTTVDCILGKIRRFKFPKSDCASVPVSYPFVFVKTQ
jgi:hypothetical protein